MTVRRTSLDLEYKYPSQKGASSRGLPANIWPLSVGLLTNRVFEYSDRESA